MGRAGSPHRPARRAGRARPRRAPGLPYLVGPPPRPAWDPTRTGAAALTALTLMLRGFADLAIWLLVFGWIPLLVLAILLVATRGRRTARVPA